MPLQTAKVISTSVTTTFTQVQSSDRLLNQVQNNIADAINPLLALVTFNQAFAKTFLKGKISSKVSLVTGSNTITHNLGYSPTGWLIIRARSAATFFDTQDANLTPTKTLLITSSATCSIDIFIF
jgi:hypothetical protein